MPWPVKSLDLNQLKKFVNVRGKTEPTNEGKLFEILLAAWNVLLVDLSTKLLNSMKNTIFVNKLSIKFDELKTIQ